MRTVLLLALACLSLGACNIVVTEQPIFSNADAVGAPPIREGIWINAAARDERDRPCRFNQERPVNRWPKCANWLVIRGNEALIYDREKAIWESQPIILSAVEPRILQVGASDPPEFLYLHLRTVKLDAQGRMIGAEVRPVTCSPEPVMVAFQPKEEVRAERPPRRRRVLAQPEPVIELPAADQADVPIKLEKPRPCIPPTKEGVRAAARASVSLQDGLMDYRWIREGFR